MDYYIIGCKKESLDRVVTALEHSRKVQFRREPNDGTRFRRYSGHSGLPEGIFLKLEIGEHDMSISTNRSHEKASRFVDLLHKIAGGSLRIEESASSLEEFFGPAY